MFFERTTVVLLVCLLAGALAGCSGGGSGRVSGEPARMINDTLQPPTRRADAVRVYWDSLEPEQKPREADALRQVYWRPTTPAPLRLAIAETIGRDPDPEVSEHAKALFRLSLPHESEREVIEAVSGVIADRDWTELTTTLVRTMSRSRAEGSERERAEAKALLRLHPNRSLEQIVFVQFLRPTVHPDDEATMRGVDLRRRFRTEAWDLLARLDPGGTQRRTMLAEIPADVDPMVEAVSAMVGTFGVLPETGMEIRWAETMRAGDGRQRRWWQDAEAAHASLSDEQRRGFAMRHIEPVRWAKEHRPEWLMKGRSALYAELESRLHGRQIYVRTATRIHTDGPNRERLSDWRDRLLWGDLLAILIADEALKDPGVRRELYRQAEADRADTTTEYGGTLDAAGDGFRAQLFVPRPSERLGDRAFVASEEMLANSARSLIHYHMHVQQPSQAAYAGPGREDLVYAARSGRTCMVFTSVDRGRLNADIYFPHGAVVDLGLVDD